MSKRLRLPVTDHAVLRYLERVCAIDIEAIRQRIYRDVRPALTSGGTGVTVNGIRYRFKGGVVATVLVGPRRPRRELPWPAKE